MGLIAIVCGAVFLVLQNTLIQPTGVIGWVLLVVAAVALVAAWWYIGRADRPVLAFIGTSIATIAVSAGIFVTMFPNLGFANAEGASQLLNIATAASQDSTLMLMLIAAIVFLPIVLGYTIWTYWVFRRPLSVDNMPEDDHTPALAG